MKIIIAALSITLIVILPTICMANESDELQIHVVDVGFGESIVLHQPISCTILIDAGEFFDANRIANTLNELGVKALDMVIISHPHIDHFGGLFEILPEFPATKFFDNGHELERHAQFDEYKKLRDLQPYRVLKYGDKLQCGKVTINVLNPPISQTTVSSVNNTSLVLMITYEDFRLIHMGELDHAGEKRLMKANDDLKANIIKVGHHGMKEATSKALLTVVSPDYAVISSSGECNESYGCQPDENVLTLLTDFGISYSRTDQNGNIKIIVNHDGFSVTTASTQ